MVASQIVLLKGGEMTRGSILEYAKELRVHYAAASKEGKGRMLDQFTMLTGCHRKAAIRLLHTERQAQVKRKRGRPRRYGHDVTSALRAVWEAADRLCSKRLHPFLPEILSVLKRHGEITVTPEAEAQLCQISPATIDRLLRPYRLMGRRRPFATTKPGSLLKHSIPIRTFTDWEDSSPGFLEVDLVAHCGDNTEGFYLTTLTTVDVASGWSECIGVWGKGQQRVRAAIHRVRQRLPFPLRGLDSDNGSEFINQHLYSYCQDEGITFTRSRPYKKNDSCHVEQKNWSVVRRLVGYDRYDSKAALETLNRVHDLTRLYVNFFQPMMKLIHKTRHGARVHKVYDPAQTPYQRLLSAGILPKAKEQELAATYHCLNPVLLLRQINENLERLWAMATYPSVQPARGKTKEASVTGIVRQPLPPR
jgi:hypothetical protein